MEFGWTDKEDAYRKHIADFVKATLPDDWEQLALHGPGSPAQTAYSKLFCPLLAAEGLLVPHWPREYGGEDGQPWDHFVLGEELWAAGEPRGPQYMNINWIGPTILRYGTEAQKERFLPPIREGKVTWCQGFSEPSAGSDLAALRTHAEEVEGGFSVSGAKIWTSYAGLADHCFLLARTSPDRKGGIVILLVDMTSPGIQVKDIPSVIGRGDLHEVFFDEVFVPSDCLLGEVGQAWEIIGYGLANERVGIPRYAFSERILDRAVERLKRSGRFEDATVQDGLGRVLALCRAARQMVYKVIDDRAKGRDPDAMGNLTRVAIVRAEQAVSDFMLEYVQDGMLGEDPMQVAFHQRAIAAGIASGAAEIQLNLVARNYLKLPRD
jgi:alkylation response protein AidB-like acyl-CoA dehydrogenase